MAAFVLRMKYYMAWKLSSAVVIFCGLSYKYETPQPSLDNVSNKPVSPHNFGKVVSVIITEVECEMNFRQNIRVKFYLKILF